MGQSKDFGFGEDEAIVRDTARKFLDQHCNEETLRRVVASDHEAAYEGEVPPCSWDPTVWQQIVDLGWPALAVPEEAGGVGMKLVGVAGLVEEAGRRAFPSPLLSTILAAYPMRAAATDAATAWLGRIAAGEAATLATTNAEGSLSLEDTDVTARQAGDGVVLDGTASFVQDARKCSFFVVSAKLGDGVGLYAVPADAPGVTLLPDRILDLTRDQARLCLEDVRVPADAVLAPAPAGADALRGALPSILTLLSADIVGAGEWQLQTTAEYAKVRKQFGRPIGFFQAVKHSIANVLLSVDATRSLVYWAACAVDEEPEGAELAARMAKASAGETASFASNRCLQMHGGIGVTWEATPHIYLKRQRHTAFLFGDSRDHRRVVGAVLP